MSEPEPNADIQVEEQTAEPKMEGELQPQP